MQEEFFHTFNALLDKGSQIVVSADRPPNRLSRIMKELNQDFQVVWWLIYKNQILN